MPKQIDEKELASIEQCIAAGGEGVSISDIEAMLAAEGILLNRRTLLRRLDLLVACRRIMASGSHKGRRYRLTKPDTIAGVAPAATEDYPKYIPLSEEGRDILAYVRRPVQGRVPVGYQREFLLSYEPNSTAYLDADTIRHLHDIGHAPDPGLAAGTFARQVLGRLLIDLSWASSRLEGNTYSLLETERLIAFGQVAEGKAALETQMILNHKQAIEFLVESADEVGFNRYTILNLHALLADNLLPNPGACGRLRAIPVGIGGSVYTPLTTPQLLDEYFQRFLDTAAAIDEPFEQAFFAFVHLPYLQVFEDVNKRVSRLAANVPLIRHNLCPLSFIDVPERAYMDAVLGVYELNRTELLRDLFVWAFERSVKRYLVLRQEVGEPDPFRLQYREALQEVIRGVVKGKKEAMEKHITDWTNRNIPAADRVRFRAMVAQELKGLHEGNIARYQIRPSEFAAWRKI